MLNKKKKVAATNSFKKADEVIKILRRENLYLKRRVAALEAREAQLLTRLLDTGYDDLDYWETPEQEKAIEETFGKDYKPMTRTNVNTLVKKAKDKHEARIMAAKQEAAVEAQEEKQPDVEVRIGEAKKKFYIETATGILNGKGQ